MPSTEWRDQRPGVRARRRLRAGGAGGHLVRGGGGGGGVRTRHEDHDQRRRGPAPGVLAGSTQGQALDGTVGLGMQ